jgi:bacteriocin biosynthesis cyclodehydratase domain-containing protein
MVDSLVRSHIDDTKVDAERPLPTRPRLIASVDIVPLNGGTTLVRGHRGTVALSGEFTAEALPAFLARLDGERTLAEVLDEAEPAFRAEAQEFLRLMSVRGYLSSGPEQDGPVEARTGYWALNAPDATTAAARLGAAHVTVAGAGAVASSLSIALTDLGAGLGSTLPRATLIGSDPNTVEAAMAGATIIVLASDGMSLAGVDAVNAFSIDHGIPWLLVRIDRTRALFGPYVIPGETACFTCYELRARANAERPSEHEALYRHWRTVADRPADVATPPSAGVIVGNWVASDLARAIASGRPPTTTGRIVALDLHSLQATTHEILRLPRCPACSRLRARPLTRIWDIPNRRVAEQND